MIRALIYCWMTIVLLVPAAWAGGVVELPVTGQASCFDDTGNPVTCEDTGQDGELQAGLPWPSPRFMNMGDGSVLDTLTGLMWTWDGNLMSARDPSFDNDESPGDGRVYWIDALQYITKLNSDAFLGRTDWRLPNVREMESLVDAERHTPALSQGHPFVNIQDCGYWTGTSAAADLTSAWVVNMKDGSVYYSFKERRKRCVWPVRLALGRIAGTVTHNEKGLRDVNLTLAGDGALTTRTDTHGSYLFIGLSDGLYTVTPRLNGYTFSPSSLTVSVSRLPVLGQNFAASCPDRDADGICDFLDLCPDVPNPEQRDCDRDLIGDLCDPDPYPSEVCDGLDNDCDGQTDEGVTNICGTCGPIPAEVCDGRDNDCDGGVDENLSRSCDTACGPGTETCISGLWANCTAPPLQEEICDGLDNDCNGQIDDGVANACGACGPVPEEVCDGQDNDCDGLTDEGCACTPGQTRVCGSDEGECERGIQHCSQAQWEANCVGAVGARAEICHDLLDNDCDGSVDEDCTQPDEAGGPAPGETAAPEQDSAPAQTTPARRSSGGGGCSVYRGISSENGGGVDGLLVILVLLGTRLWSRRISIY